MLDAPIVNKTLKYAETLISTKIFSFPVKQWIMS